MAFRFKLSSFNVENLFSRPKVFNLHDRTVGDNVIAQIGALQTELRRDVYDEQRIMQLWPEVKGFVSISEERGKLWRRRRRAIVGVRATGRADWDGTLRFKRAKYNEMARNNTAKVIRSMRADIQCIVEAEDRTTLKQFSSHLLNSKFPYSMLIDGNDQRGIDVGVLSKFPLRDIRSHIDDGTARSKMFSRDCLEIDVQLSPRRKLTLLVNHLKSKGFGAQATSDARRLRQTEQIRRILRKYDLRRDLVAVVGDLNDTPRSAPLRPLTRMRRLHDVLELQFPDNEQQRWTYHFNSNEQIDYILVSDRLADHLLEAGVERRGMHSLRAHSVADEQPFRTVTHPSNQASDHGAVWATFDI